MEDSHPDNLAALLFPKGTDFDEAEREVLFEQYKLFVDTSERLVARRQAVNTFFLSANALALSAIGLVANGTREADWGLIGIFAIAVAAMMLCWAWRTLVRSYAQLNRGKFDVIDRLEDHVPAAMFRAEWAALGHGRDVGRYRPFTRTEGLVSSIFLAIYGLVAVGTLLWVVATRALGWGS